ncbi:hypothetical protein [Antrihabitans sp. YC2-6]|uniref:hypothetical protein n=1 Tax=Antrihabitans sp. YC2-6 TaxID=2799498 RepID=UPI0018F4207D|nr:hypothetical protein [Antrihabitans sp. YC2-6]MBJ8343954.1 hypothetical protein [Antrihabitans sp. YC2-6]
MKVRTKAISLIVPIAIIGVLVAANPASTARNDNQTGNDVNGLPAPSLTVLASDPAAPIADAENGEPRTVDTSAPVDPETPTEPEVVEPVEEPVIDPTPVYTTTAASPAPASNEDRTPVSAPADSDIVRSTTASF